MHGGTLFPFPATSGLQHMPLTGSTVSGLISASTFYFGPGNQLFNQNQAAIGGASAPTIAALDPFVVGSAVEWQRWSLEVGVRLNRRLSRRFSLEFTGDYRRSVLAFSQDALNGIEEARASFVSALARALANAPAPALTSVATLTDQQSAPQVVGTAAVLVNLKQTGSAIPYVVGGGGAVFMYGNTPNASIIGTYQFGTSSQVIGTDTVELQYSLPGHDYFGFGGGGVRYYVSQGWGVRVDARAELQRNQLSNIVTVTPARALKSTGSPFPIVTSGALQFSSTAPLTGPSYPGVTSFEGRNVEIRVGITAGIFWRF